MYIIFKNEQNFVYSKYTIFTILQNYVHSTYIVSFSQKKKKKKHTHTHTISKYTQFLHSKYISFRFLNPKKKKKYISFKYVHYSIHSTFNVKNVQNYLWGLMK